MEESMEMKVPGAIEVTEKKENLHKIWNTLVDINKTKTKIQLKLAPLGLKVATIFAPEAAPILIPLSKFLKNKEIQELGEKNQDTLAAFLKGDHDEALERANEIYEMLNDNEDSLISDIGDTYDAIRGGIKK